MQCQRAGLKMFSPASWLGRLKLVCTPLNGWLVFDGWTTGLAGLGRRHFTLNCPRYATTMTATNGDVNRSSILLYLFLGGCVSWQSSKVDFFFVRWNAKIIYSLQLNKFYAPEDCWFYLVRGRNFTACHYKSIPRLFIPFFFRMNTILLILIGRKWWI